MWDERDEKGFAAMNKAMDARDKERERVRGAQYYTDLHMEQIRRSFLNPFF